MERCVYRSEKSIVISLDFLFKNNRHLSVGFFLIFIGSFIKSLFAHNYEHWFTIKVVSLSFLCIGLFVLSLKFFSVEKPQGKFIETFTDKALYYIATSFFIVFSLIFIVMLEQIGKEINYSIRSFYLAKNTEQKKAMIVDGKRLSILRTGSDDFYVFLIKEGNTTIKQGLLVDYLKKDFGKRYDENIIVIDEKRMQVHNLLGKRVVIEVSKKHPSFFRLVSLD